MSEPEEELLTVVEVAGRLRVNPQTVRNWIDAGRLPALRVGARRVRVQRSDLDEFIGWKNGDAVGETSDLSFDAIAVASALDEVATGLAALAAALRSTH